MDSSKDTESVVRRHVAAFARGDIAALLPDYADDVVFLSPITGVINGRAALEQLYLELFGGALAPATTAITFGPILTSGEMSMVAWEAISASVRTQGASDTFVVRNSKIVAQTGAGSFVPLSAK